MTRDLIAGGALIAAVAVAASLAAPPVFAQSLGDVARQEAARRKAVKAPVKVFTNDSLKVEAQPVAPAPAGEPAAPATGAAPDAAKQGEKEAAAPEPAKDQEYWRSRMADALAERDKNAFLIEAVQSRINALTTDFYARDDPYQRAQIETERNRSLAALDEMKKRQQELEQKVADIQEEARRANVPPGWLR